MADDDSDSKTENKRRPMGSGSLTYDAKRDLWVGVAWMYDSDGVRVQRRVTSRLKSTASDKLEDLKAAIRNGTAVARPSKTMKTGAWLDHWLLEIKKPKVKPKTIKSYEGTIRLYLKPHIGDVRLDKLTPSHVRDMYKALREHSTRNACFAIAVQLVYGRSVTTITPETPQLPDSPLLASRVDAARFLCMSVTQVDRLRRKGVLRAKKMGGKIVFPWSELEKYVHRLPWELDEDQ